MSRELPDAYRRLRELTSARVALGTTGSSLRTNELLEFQYDWARARDAVHYAVDFDALAHRLFDLGCTPIPVDSAAGTRATYLRRPDLGRQLSAEGRSRLKQAQHAWDIGIVVADGLSGRAVEENAAPLLEALKPRLEQRTLAPVVLVNQGRVAVGDPIGKILQARLTITLIGERPGLSAANSLGAYITYNPRPGRTDAERNCVSNIRIGGNPPEIAASTIARIVQRALAARLTGIELKDDRRAIESA